MMLSIFKTKFLTILKISIITATYNSAATIGTCIASVNEQTYSDIEHIIIDGASNDNTLEIIKSMPNRVSKIVSEPDRGIYDAMNKGIKLATGDIIGILNSDDQFYDNHVIKKIVLAFKDRNIDAVYGNLIYSYPSGKVARICKSKSFRPGLFSQSWTPPHPTFYCRKVLYEKFGLYKTDYIIAADVELMLRFIEVNKIKTRYLNEFLVNMRKGGVSNQGIQSTIIITREIKKAFKENELPFNLIKYLLYKGLKAKEYFLR